MSQALREFSQTVKPEISIQVIGHRWNVKAVVSWNGITHEAISSCLAPNGSLPHSEQYKDALDKATRSAQTGLYNRIMVFYADILEARNNYEKGQTNKAISAEIIDA
jgi:hypothetical protein